MIGVAPKPRRLALFALALALPVTAFAACAETKQGNLDEEDPSQTIDPRDGGRDTSADAESDAPTCDAASSDCVTDAISCDDAAWCPVPSPLAPASVLTSVWGWSKTNVLAVGSVGALLRWDGSKWSALDAPEKKITFSKVWGAAPDDVWLVAGTDALYHATKLVGGAPDWRAEPNLGGEAHNAATLFAVWGSGAGDVRIGGARLAVDTPDGFAELNQFVRAAGETTWDGVEGSGIVRAIWGSSATDVWMVVDNSATNPWEQGMTLHGTGPSAAELRFTPVDSRSAVGLNAVWGSSANDVWAVGELGTIRRIAAGDARWRIVTSPTTARLRSVWGSGPKDIWAVGQAGTILHYDGTSWTSSVAALPVGPKPELYGVWGSGPDDVWIVGDGIILHSTGKKAGGGS
ncbi:MAG: hypothetical protein KF795_33950 [Labilithrix sp.]|nr:hypothetical protein [Labilithrix sp.]